MTGAGENNGPNRDSATIRVNGRSQDIETGLTVQRLLERLEITARYALVERNGEPVERSSFPDVELSDGDEVVVARPVAGG
ncbi:MAG: sulfur carrier protein ThiS [Gaiellaceae bacterium]